MSGRVRGLPVDLGYRLERRLMSMLGTPKAIARKTHTKSVAAARAKFTQDIIPAQRAYERAIQPHRLALQKAIDAADAAYFEAVGR